MNTKDNYKWYALFVVTGEEDKVKERIYFRMKDELKALVPKRRMRERKEGKWQERIRTLFPGYVLLNGQINTEVYNLISTIPGVIRFLKNNDGPQYIDEHEMYIIQKLTSENEIIGFSSVDIRGRKIQIIDGPLTGMEGYIQSIDRRKGRAKVLINLMGEPRIVELCVSLIQSA